MDRCPPSFTVRAVLFDMDGTLIDSTPAVDRSWAAWERLWNVRLGVRASALGRPARDIVAERVPAADAEAAFRDIERLEVADTDGIVVLPGRARAARRDPRGPLGGRDLLQRAARGGAARRDRDRSRRCW